METPTQEPGRPGFTVALTHQLSDPHTATGPPTPNSALLCETVSKRHNSWGLGESFSRGQRIRKWGICILKGVDNKRESRSEVKLHYKRSLFPMSLSEAIFPCTFLPPRFRFSSGRKE